MLSFLLDEHISPTIAHQINRKRPEIIIFPLISWQEGQYLGLDDDIVLTAATDAHLTFVTYDQNTIPPLLCAWGDVHICMTSAGVMSTSAPLHQRKQNGSTKSGNKSITYKKRKVSKGQKIIRGKVVSSWRGNLLLKIEWTGEFAH